jgi:hypothetical protein
MRHTACHISLCSLLFLAVLTVHPHVAGAETITGGDPCDLVEALPGPKDPIRKRRELRQAFAALDRSGHNTARYKKAHTALLKPLLKALKEAADIFHAHQNPDAKRKWKPKDQTRAQRFLKKYVQGGAPMLQIGMFGFEPQPSLRAALMWSACRAGDRKTAIALGRQATSKEEASARAYAALLLLTDGQSDQARELLGSMSGSSFLVAWLKAELKKKRGARQKAHSKAKRRGDNPVQKAALEAQSQRYGLQSETPPSL